MFIELLKGALIGSAWLHKGSIVDVPEDRAKKLIADKAARFASGPEKFADPDADEVKRYTGAKPAPDEPEADPPVKRGPGRPRKDA